MAYCRSFVCVRGVLLVRPRWEKCQYFSSKESVAAVQGTLHPQKSGQRKRQKPKWAGDLSWEKRLASVVTPLWRLPYDEQLEFKQKQQERILEGFCGGENITFPVLPIRPSPVTDGYRNKSTFSVNKGVDGNPKTVGFYVGRGKHGNIVCVNGDHLPNMPEKHKQVARCYQEFIRRSSLEPCLLFHKGGHWREVTVRTNTAGHTMAVVYFHPQELTREELAAHKADLTEFFTQGAGSACELDSLYFQETAMTRCSHEDSPYQLLYGHTHIHEQVNAAAAQVLYSAVRDLCVPNSEDRTGTLLDVCCGTGAMGITASPRVQRLVGVELVEQAVEDARYNAALNKLDKCEFVAGKAEDVLPGLVSQLAPGDGRLTALVNPSRAGLHYKVIRALRNQPAIRRVVYVSCKPDGEALRNFRELCCAPDTKRKLTGDAFAPRLAVPVDMFPHTEHCELVIVFER
ncbi:tRNA (uracil-5-)-methyltransferase homolog B isoform X2 [Syngnathoides biaculeatus]|uniref:tRNA (uracil-5-)-methyltransferase homolog B isoform X2 n=1 Tax=Syngnathoides biaculeatus TaxID=300417 RepID=UPI002ADE7C75|nr:tRNA (uracil-5-)-methyltransferase homolog B isoform X2 [Syngnathoides biaculeatus]